MLKEVYQVQDIYQGSPNIYQGSPNIYQESQLIEILDSLKINDSFKKFSDQRNQFSEEEKQSIYEDGSYLFSIPSSFKRTAKLLNPLSGPFRSFFIRFFQKDTFKDQFKKDVFEIGSAGIRLFVHLGLLKKPQNVDINTITSNIKHDAKSLKRQLWILEKSAILIPELKPALPIIQKIKPILTQTADMGSQMMIASQHKEIVDETIQETKQDLASVLY